MKKIVVLLALVMSIGMFLLILEQPVSAENPMLNRTQVLEKIDELTNLLGDEYCTVNQSGCTPSCKNSITDGGSHIQCDNCKVGNIIKTDWFKKKFNISDNQKVIIPGGTESWSCMGFVNIAWWYIYETNSDSNVRKQVNSNRLTYSELIKTAMPGDYVRIWKDGESRHSIIYISGDSKGMQILDGNGTNSGANNGCLVENHYVTHYNNSRYTFNVVRANNYDPTITNSNTIVDKSIYDGTYYIVSSLDGEKSTIGVASDSKNSKANVHLWTRHTGDSQKWEFKKSGNYYTITNVRSGKALDVYDASTTSGANVWQYDVNGTKAQQWFIEDAGNGYVYIKSALGNYLDVSGGKSDNSTNIQVYKGNQTAAQKFKLVPAYYLDLNGKLDGTNSNTIDGYGRADVYIDGKLVADDITDYYMLIASDSKFEIKDINPTSGYVFDGIVEGASSGTMGEGKRSITLSFSKKHAHSYNTFDYQTDHPHRGYKKCSCGDIQYTDVYASDNNCRICNPVRTVSVYYNANGGNEPPSPQSVMLCESVRISDETLTRNGYAFLGWALTPTATEPKYTHGEFITLDDDITLYAVWKKDSNASKFILRIGHTEASVFGVTKYNDVAPILENHRTMLPVRFVAENLGATVSWDDPTQTVTISKGNILIEIVIGSNYAYVNGEPRYIDTPAFLRNSRTYTPIRFVCESLGATVDWEEETQSVIITK